MNEPHYLKVEKTARYFLSAPADGEYHTICFALHGYGQLGQYFIRNFREIDPGVLFIAPEGLHRFYLNGTGGRVGTNWMTKEDRLKDIEDYCNYLDQVYRHFSHLQGESRKVGILGFSQGVATACRWLTNSHHHFDFLINWAGAFPPDLDFERSIERMRNIPVHLLVGNRDEYISTEDFEKHLNLLDQQGYQVQPRIFEGTHKIYPEVLREVFEELNS